MIRGLHSQNLNIDHLTNVFGGHSLNWFHPYIWALFKRYLLNNGKLFCPPLKDQEKPNELHFTLFCLIYNVVDFLQPFFLQVHSVYILGPINAA